MQSEGKSIYRKESLERLSQPEQLNDYIRVTTPAVWVVMIALVTALLGLLAWGIFGKVTLSMEARSILTSGGYICYVDDLSGIEEDMQVVVGKNEGTITYILDYPMDYQMLSEIYPSYILYELDPAQYVYGLVLDVPVGEGVYGNAEDEYAIFDTTIILRHVRPISLVLGSAI